MNWVGTNRDPPSTAPRFTVTTQQYAVERLWIVALPRSNGIYCWRFVFISLNSYLLGYTRSTPGLYTLGQTFNTCVMFTQSIQLIHSFIYSFTNHIITPKSRWLLPHVYRPIVVSAVFVDLHTIHQRRAKTTLICVVVLCSWLWCHCHSNHIVVRLGWPKFLKIFIHNSFYNRILCCARSLWSYNVMRWFNLMMKIFEMLQIMRHDLQQYFSQYHSHSFIIQFNEKYHSNIIRWNWQRLERDERRLRLSWLLEVDSRSWERWGMWPTADKLLTATWKRFESWLLFTVW